MDHRACQRAETSICAEAESGSRSTTESDTRTGEEAERKIREWRASAEEAGKAVIVSCCLGLWSLTGTSRKEKRTSYPVRIIMKRNFYSRTMTVKMKGCQDPKQLLLMGCLLRRRSSWRSMFV